MGVEKLYATILGGNPNANIYRKDAFGTSVANAISSLRPGGALYKRAQGTLGDAPDGTILASYSAAQPGATGSSPSRTSLQQIDAAVGQAILNSIVQSFAGNDQLVGDYGPSTQPSTPFSNEADVEGVGSDADYSELAEMIKSSVATNKEEDRAMRQKLMSNQLASQTYAQKANMADLMRQAMEAFKTPTSVF